MPSPWLLPRRPRPGDASGRSVRGAARVDETRAYQANGARSAGHWLGAATGDTATATYLKSCRGWEVLGSPHAWRLVPPDAPGGASGSDAPDAPGSRDPEGRDPP
ncbi:MAG TPA: hypothetical protein VFW06_03400 [Acidimicrobiia bacterium]|nr:hypothetical protein [Acidimicrobiia bacterium]